MSAERGRRGFANPEYLLALFGLVLLAALILPAVARTRDRSRNLQSLARLRAAVASYKAAHNGAEPPSLWDLSHEDGIPQPKLRQHTALGVDAAGDDTGEYKLDNGRVFINCTHTDSRGAAWASY